MPRSFYYNQNFVNCVYAVDIAIEDHFKDLLFLGEENRVVYSSNAYAFRQRSKGNDGDLAFPFMNYHMTNYEPGKRSWWHVRSYTKGVFVPELGIKIQYAPITLSYECTFWCHKNEELVYAIAGINFDTDNITTLSPEVEIESQQVPFAALLSYSGNQYDPQFNEQDWLDTHKIHSASLNFTLDTMALQANTDITIPNEVVLDMYAFHGEKDAFFPIS